MAEETILLDVEVNADKARKQLAAVLTEMEQLKAQQKELKQTISDSGKVTANQAEKLTQLESAMKANKATAKSLSSEINQLGKSSLQYGDSLNEMRRYLSDLQAQYDGLSKSERENKDVGGKLQEQIKEQHDAVLELEGATGRMQRNVGNYQKAFENAIPGLGKFSSTLNLMGTSMEEVSSKGTKAFSEVGKSAKAFGKVFLTPPIILIAGLVGLIVAAFNKLKEAFNKSDDAGTALASGLAVLKPIGTWIGKKFDELANTLGKFVEKCGDAAVAVAEFANSIGIGDGEFVKAANSAKALVKSVDELEQSEREYVKQSAENEKEISRLRLEAENELNPKRRQKLLNEATRLEEENLEQRKAILQKRVDNLKAKADEEVDTSDATKDAIAEAEAELLRAEKESLDRRKEISAQQRTARAETVANAKEAADKEIEVRRLLEDAVVESIDNEYARTLAQTKLQGEREIEDLQRRLDTEKNLTDEAKQSLSDLIVQKRENLNVELEKLEEDYVQDQYEQSKAEKQQKVQAANERNQALITAEIDNINARYELAQSANEQSLSSEAERNQKALELERQQMEETLELQKQLATLQYEALLQDLEQQALAEIANAEYTEEEKKAIQDQYAALKLEAKENLNNQLMALDQEYAAFDEKTIAEAKAKMESSFMAMGKSASTAFGQISDLLAEYGEENEDAAAASKAFALTQIITDQAISIADTAKAMSAAVAGATVAAASTGPAAPFTLAAYIAEMVGLVIGAIGSLAASFVSAKQVLSEDSGSYATGGIIGGTSYSGDRLKANVNSGEMILNRDQQTRLFDIANGQGGGLFDYSALADTMAAAVAAQPAPVMVYSEFSAFTERTAKYDDLAKV